VLCPERGERWDAAELARGADSSRLASATPSAPARLRRAPTDVDLAEWRGVPPRHLLVSAAIRVDACGYRHDWREEGLSDHSTLMAELDVVPG
jgi:hypothetical protein